MANKPKIILWDVEVSGIVTTQWNLYPSFIHHSNMLDDWFMICVAWKELGSKKVNVVSVLDDPKRFNKNHKDDYHVIKTLRDVLQDTDLLIHHNGDKFDLKMFNSRLIYHNLEPLQPILTVDTLKEIKKVSKFTSHRLDFLGTKFFGFGKDETPPGTWLRAMQGNKKDIQTMAKYNKTDVVLLEKIYEKFKPYMKNHPHIWANKEDRFHTCRNCGSTHIKKNGTKVTKAGVLKQEIQCQKCGSYERIPIQKV